MTILRSGSTDKYSKNWAAAFGEKKGRGKPVTVTATAGKAATGKTVSKPKAKKQAKATKQPIKQATGKRG